MKVFTAECNRNFSVGEENEFLQAVKKNEKKRRKAEDTVNKISKTISRWQKQEQTIDRGDTNNYITR